jgi:hypothetical protein
VTFGTRLKKRLAILALPMTLTAVAGSDVSWAESRVCETASVGAVPLSLCKVADI